MKPAPQKYRTTNWKAYNASLKARGSLLIWLDPAMNWHGQANGKRGRSPSFSDEAIQFCLSIKCLFSLPLRQAMGMTQSLSDLKNRCEKYLGADDWRVWEFQDKSSDPKINKCSSLNEQDIESRIVSQRKICHIRSSKYHEKTRELAGHSANRPQFMIALGHIINKPIIDRWSELNECMNKQLHALERLSKEAEEDLAALIYANLDSTFPKNAQHSSRPQSKYNFSSTYENYKKTHTKRS